MVSHDLRTPLTAIRGTLTLLGAGAVDPCSDNGKARVSDAERSADRLIKLVNDLLDLEKMGEGKLHLERDFVNMGDVVSRSLASVRAYAEQRQISINADPCFVEVLADEDRLVQVLVNLLSNAIKFSPPGGSVSISHTTDSSFCQIRVADSGPGIPQQARQQLFQRFQQLDITREHHKLGSGLGLVICKAIIEAHSGEIGVESEIGKGSVFWFRVSLAPPEASA